MSASTIHVRRRTGRLIAWMGLLAALAAAAGAANNESLGPLALSGLAAPASAALDQYAVPLIEARSFEDSVRVEGFLHARERYAQMDFLRRYAAGEVAELLGPLASVVDKQQRTMQLRAVAKRHVEALPPRHRAVLAAYVQGVNAGLASLEAPPAEHALLGVKPAPWAEEDSALVVLAMSAMLNDNARVEPAIGAVVAILPPEMAGYLASPIARDDATVVPEVPQPPSPPIPGPDVLDTRGLKVAAANGESGLDATSLWAAWSGDHVSVALGGDAMRSSIGSNGWVIAGSHSKSGAAILANDMHLAITVPTVWYRVSMRFGDPQAPRTLDGVSLPGAPGIVSGSNGSIAWGFTNVEGDFIDFVVVEPDPADPAKYLVPGGSEPFTVEREMIKVRGLADQTLEVKGTRWGPIVASDSAGRPLALHWTALQDGGVNFDLLDLAEATSVTEALDIAARWRAAQQNVMVAARNGDIGWTIAGALPKRTGFDGSIPVSWADGSRGWSGWTEGADRPRVVNPPAGFVATANQRTLPVAQATALLGNLFGEPDRAHRICELLAATDLHDEASCAAIQLDTAVPSVERWRDAMLPALERGAAQTGADGTPTERAAKLKPIVEALKSWNGRADADQCAVAIVERARRRTSRAILKGIIEAGLAKADPELTPTERATRAERLLRVPVHDENLVRIVEARPDHLLPPGEASWDALFERIVLEAAASSTGKSGFLRWGQVNTSNFVHPLAMAAPQMANQFGLPAHEQCGHHSAVRVAGPSFGASDRLVVSPGREAQALIQTPGGQSGNPKSPHYSDLHPFWRDGKPLPLQPGPSATRLDFAPAQGAGDAAGAATTRE